MVDREPPEVTAAEPGSFPWSVLHDRHPALIEKVRGGWPYPPAVSRALDDLAAEIEGPIRPLPADAHDAALWAGWGREYLGRRWYDVPFLWAESYFYRKLLHAVGFFRPGAWRGIDPFEPVKSAELAGTAMRDELAALDAADLDGLLTASLWGNQADLGFRAVSGRAAALVVDQSAELLSSLRGTVCVVADNAGRELAPDLFLVDRLLATGQVQRVVLHVKAYPYFTSDATTGDVLACLRRIAASPAAGVADRLGRALRDGVLDVRAHPFSCAPWPYERMPADLAADFASATMTVMKGDLNYRRLVGDRSWDLSVPFSSVTAYFPGPVAAVRTLKSDVVVGVPARVSARLAGTGWRTSGEHALVQVGGSPALEPASSST